VIPKDCRSVERPWQETIDANVAEVAEAVGEISAADRQLVGEDSGSVAKVTTFEANVVSAGRVVRAVMLEVSVASADLVVMISVVSVVSVGLVVMICVVSVVSVGLVVMICVVSVVNAVLVATMIAVRVVRAVMLEVSVARVGRVVMISVVSVVNVGLVARVGRVVMISVVSVASVGLAATMIAVRVASVTKMTPRRTRLNSAVQKCSPARVHVSTAKRSRLRHGKTVKSTWWMRVPFGVEDSKRDIEGAMTGAAMTTVANPDRDAPSAEGLRCGAAIETVPPSRQSLHCQTNLRVK
jgi:hypothetical protein